MPLQVSEGSFIVQPCGRRDALRGGPCRRCGDERLRGATVRPHEKQGNIAFHTAQLVRSCSAHQQLWVGSAPKIGETRGPLTASPREAPPFVLIWRPIGNRGGRGMRSAKWSAILSQRRAVSSRCQEFKTILARPLPPPRLPAPSARSPGKGTHMMSCLVGLSVSSKRGLMCIAASCTTVCPAAGWRLQPRFRV